MPRNLKEHHVRLDSQELINKCLNCERVECVNCIGTFGVDRRRPDCRRAIEQLTPTGEVIRVFQSIAEAAMVTGVGSANINNFLRGKSKRKLAGGFKWRYADEEKRG